MRDGSRALIELEGIGKVFSAEEVETHALRDVHLRIREGEFVAIAGPSGCGKTTLLSLLGLLDTPTSGEYRLGKLHRGGATIVMVTRDPRYAEDAGGPASAAPTLPGSSRTGR